MKKIIVFIVITFVFSNTALAYFKPDENPYYSQQTYLTKINFTNYLINSYSRGDNVTVAVIDEGVWFQHPDLVGANWINKDEICNNGTDDDNNGYIDDCYGWNFLDNNNDLLPNGNHGTAVAGIIVAQDNYIGIVGIAPKAKVMSLTVCNKSGCDKDGIYKAIKYATQNGADIINLSLGTNGYVGYDSKLTEAIDYAYSNDVVVVVSAGNGDIVSLGSDSLPQLGMNTDMFQVSPLNNQSRSNMILGVGALDASGFYRANWSNYGKAVNVYAPGEDIITSVVPSYSSGYGYDSLSGTSFSAPMVSAAAALLKSNYSLSNQEIINSIINTEAENKGRIDVRRALENIDSNKKRSYIGKSKLIVNQEDKITSSAQQSIVTSTEGEKKNSRNEFIENEKKLAKLIDATLSKKLSGRILLQVENKGEAWYIYPKNNKKYYMASGNEAYNIMRKLGLGATNKDVNAILASKNIAKKYIGKILLQVEEKGQAYYINFDGTAYYLKDGETAYNVMRELGLGIKNNDIRKIEIGEME